jgi:hypothetical protein
MAAGQIAVGSGDDSNIRGNDAATSHSFKLALLEHTKQCNLRFRGKLADFIEKNGAGVRQLKTALPALQGAGKCPLLVAEQFRGDERRRNRGTIHGNKGLAGTLRTLMYGARDQFLPGTCFARNQHRRVGGSDFHDAGKDGFQGGRGAHDLLKHEDLIDLLSNAKFSCRVLSSAS